MNRHRRLPTLSADGSAFAHRGIWYSVCWSSNDEFSFSWERSHGICFSYSLGTVLLRSQSWSLQNYDTYYSMK